MEMIILIIVIVVLVKHFKKKGESGSSTSTAAPVSLGDPSQLPDSLAELRKMRDKAKKEDIRYQCRRKICERGIELYHEGKLVASPGAENDVSTLLDEMVKLINDSHTYTYIPSDDEFEFRCLREGEDMITDFTERAKNDPSVKFPFPAEFSGYSWKALAEFYTEGRVCPRNPGEARKLWRMCLVFEQRTKSELSFNLIESLMEIPAPGEDGKQEICKWIAMMYGLELVRLKKGQQAWICFPQVLQQGAELLFELNWDAIGSDDISAMLEEYQRGADAGNAYAQYRLGSFYLKGRYVKEDEEKGLALVLKAAEQNLYLAVQEATDHYQRKSSWYTVEEEKLTKQQTKEREALYHNWSKRCDVLLPQVAQQYADSLAGYFQNAGSVPTQSTAATAERVHEVEDEAEKDETYRGRFGQTDEESVFTCLDLPDVITGPYGVTYRRTSISSNSADYWGDDGSSTTIHLSDIGAAGNSAKNSDGYFHW